MLATRNPPSLSLSVSTNHYGSLCHASLLATVQRQTLRACMQLFCPQQTMVSILTAISVQNNGRKSAFHIKRVVCNETVRRRQNRTNRTHKFVIV